ncbi:MAG TPA: cupin domain-containing protein [Gammaproteobacteria bacterium]|nr:cupin [Gammaproteobacteria bacterium]HAN61306.1 cupin [Gammaproteobacteria bacterium]HIA87886.1 cupin domain-containing protein [Gammaproteobacteria bacterium]HIM69726.1 cupin domain-containing protein [Gammaproteobacteria bacterium]HIN18782.1 cupin domain-containing protein [Gammaproteobacteria bacterium]
MAGARRKSFSNPDETRTPDKTVLELVDLGSVKAARLTVQPGWTWSSCIKPVVGTDSCQANHVGTVVSGRLGIKHNDGSEMEISAGDAYVCEPGHDAWVIGDEPCVMLEFDASAAASYAKEE